MKLRMTTTRRRRRRRNRHSLFFPLRFLLHLFRATKLVFFLVSIGMFVVEISLVNERVIYIAFVFHIPVGFQIPVHDVIARTVENCRADACGV